MCENNLLIALDGKSVGYGSVEIKLNRFHGIYRGVTSVCGPNGSGKTTFGTIIAKGRYAYGNNITYIPTDLNVKMLSFSDIHSLSCNEVQYFAQRMESTMNDMVPTVSNVIGSRFDSDEWRRLAIRFGMVSAGTKKVNYLSSGELRKLLIINALLSKADVMVLDNPYIGLDVASRTELDSLFVELEKEGVSLVLLLSDPGDMPANTSMVVTIDNCEITSYTSIESYRNNEVLEDFVDDFKLPDAVCSGANNFDIAFSIQNGHARYGDKTIFENLDWTVKRGERWALHGRNGSGKSLLLSMVCADNPQGYANEIVLFDMKRGSGESVWEIKDHIGYVSPEMQLFFRSESKTVEIVAQGLRGTLNQYTRLSDKELNLAEEWLELLGIAELKFRKFNTLSSGEQRLVLVARAMIRQPWLLVLDEPFHGLDAKRISLLKSIINRMAEQNKITLIFVTHNQSELPSCIDRVKEI